jgi:hypothetical protein
MIMGVSTALAANEPKTTSVFIDAVVMNVLAI